MVQDSVQRSVGLEIPILKLWFTTREWYSQSIIPSSTINVIATLSSESDCRQLKSVSLFQISELAINATVCRVIRCTRSRQQFLNEVGLRFHILAAGSMKMTAFWDIVPCNLVEEDRCFGGTYCFHHQGDRPED
jgi:hypothetical protein